MGASLTWRRASTAAITPDTVARLARATVDAKNHSAGQAPSVLLSITKRYFTSPLTMRS